jgi:hypothetical protein
MPESRPRPLLDPTQHPPQVLTPGNKIRVNINNTAALAMAAKTGRRLLACRAIDKSVKPRSGAQTRPLTRADCLKLLDLRDNEVHGMPGLLPLLEGHVYLLRGNDATALGMVNGAMAELLSVVLDPKEPQIDTDPRKPMHVLHYQPVCLVFRLHNPNPDTAAFPGLPAGVVPLRPTSCSFKRLSADVSRPATLGAPHVAVSRRQFKVVLASAITGYTAQGKSKDRAIVDLDVSESRHPAEDVYVLLSRLRSLEGLSILRKFPLHVLQQRRDASILDEMARLTKLASALDNGPPYDRDMSYNPAAKSRLPGNGCLCQDCLVGYERPLHPVQTPHDKCEVGNCQCPQSNLP